MALLGIKNKGLKSTFLYLLVLFCSCDFLSTRTDKLIGNIYINNAYPNNISTYHLLYIDSSGINDNVIEENILNIIGNENLLLVSTKEKERIKYYYISHNKGLKPISTKEISDPEFHALSINIKIEYRFSNSN